MEIEHHPFLLLPDCPREGIKVRDMLAHRYGIRDPKPTWAHLEAEARAVGLDLDLSRQPMIYATTAGQTLIRHAWPLGRQHELADALATAHFIDATDISDPAVLAEVAGDYGFDRAEALRLASSAEEWQVTRQLARSSAFQGLRSVPHFIFDGKASTGTEDVALADGMHNALARRRWFDTAHCESPSREAPCS